VKTIPSPDGAQSHVVGHLNNNTTTTPVLQETGKIAVQTTPQNRVVVSVVTTLDVIQSVTSADGTPMVTVTANNDLDDVDELIAEGEVNTTPHEDVQHPSTR